MRILMLTHSFNSLAQRLHAELTRAGHELAVELDINDATTLEAVTLFEPEVVLAPYLKRALPERVWRALPCLIVHPGIPGDGGPTALDRAILAGEPDWGVTVLEATGELDAGPIRAWRGFPMRNAPKSSLYRLEITEAAVCAVQEALAGLARGDAPVPPAELDAPRLGRWHDALKQSDRHIDWKRDDTATVLRKIHSADGNPGVRDEILGLPCRLYDAHQEDALKGRPGDIIARRVDAVCRATVDGAVWIGHVEPEGENRYKLPATIALGDRIRHVPEILLPFYVVPQGDTWQDIRYREHGDVGYLHFDFYNGAMSTRQCTRLRIAFEHAASRPTRIIVLAGGRDFWSNGLNLNMIEAAGSAADESWRNINAMDDLCETIIRTTSHLTIAAMAGNAGAGGCYLALATDLVMAREGIVLNPHYRNMGNLYGSEFWTYVLPARVAGPNIEAVQSHRLPMSTFEALEYGLIEQVGAADPEQFEREVAAKAAELASDGAFDELIRDKQSVRLTDERERPLSEYRRDELEHMKLNFYGFDPSYHVARHRFVHHAPHAWTPLYLATHRRRHRSA